jgi:hypothetical protein
MRALLLAAPLLWLGCDDSRRADFESPTDSYEVERYSPAAVAGSEHAEVRT